MQSFVVGVYWFQHQAFAGKAYGASVALNSWEGASESCSLDDATLAVIGSESEHDYLTTVFIDSSLT